MLGIGGGRLKRYRQIADVVKFAQPKTIIEIGAHRGERAELLCREALKYNSTVHYTGYDLFEDATDENQCASSTARAGDGSGPAERLSAIPGLTFELVKGNTERPCTARSLCRSGVHRRRAFGRDDPGDYEAVKGSNVIVFDDYYTAGVDTTKFGCNEIIAGEPHELLPREDQQRRHPDSSLP
jgi:hypothetical protein